jgi:two-component system chemotaxis family response regulator WspR
MSLLIVDDSIEMCRALSALLEAEGFRDVHSAYSTLQAFQALGMAPGGETITVPDAILLDLCIPPVDGVQACRLIKERKQLHDVPIIMMTGWDTSGQLAAAFTAGASDYLTKPIEGSELLARLHSAISITRELRRRTERIERLMVVQKKTVAELEAMRWLARQDELTGAANRRHFDDLLRQEWSRGLRDGTPLGLLMIDIDYFKRFNDTYGHPLGDLLVHRVAGALRSALRRPADVLARYGGDEFAVLLPNTPTSGAEAVAEAMAQRVAELDLPDVGEADHRVTVSIGVAALMPTAATAALHLVQAADRALYDAKRNGRNQICSVAAAPLGKATEIANGGLSTANERSRYVDSARSADERRGAF